MDELVRKALELGVSEVKAIDPSRIVVEDRFPKICASSKCPGDGQAPGCPPHVMKTDAFRRLLSGYEKALVFRIDAPAGMLMTDDWQEVARLVHQMSAAIERLAEQFFENPEEQELVERLDASASLIEILPFRADLCKVQNRYYQVSVNSLPYYRSRVEQGEPEAKKWVDHFVSLGKKLSMKVG